MDFLGQAPVAEFLIVIRNTLQGSALKCAESSTSGHATGRNNILHLSKYSGLILSSARPPNWGTIKSNRQPGVTLHGFGIRKKGMSREK